MDPATTQPGNIATTRTDTPAVQNRSASGWGKFCRFTVAFATGAIATATSCHVIRNSDDPTLFTQAAAGIYGVVITVCAASAALYLQYKADEAAKKKRDGTDNDQQPLETVDSSTSNDEQPQEATNTPADLRQRSAQK